MAGCLSRRDFLRGAGIAAGAVALTRPNGRLAAAPAATTRVSPAGAPARQEFKVSEIEVPSWWAPHEVAGAEAAFAKYLTPETGLTVKYDYIDTDFNAKVFSRLAGGDPYDVITYGAELVPAYLDRGVLLPLDELIARDNLDLSDFERTAIEQWTYDGKLYGLTNDAWSPHCYFNVDLFEKAGLQVPKPTDDWTWDQLVEWSGALTVKEGDQVTQYGFASDLDPETWELWPNLNGAFVFDETISKCLLDDPAVIAAFQFIQDLLFKEGTALRPGATETGVNDLFLAGQVAIFASGTWQVGYFRSKKAEATLTWDVGMMPHNASAQEYYLPNATAGWSIPKVAKDVDASWEATKFYASKTFAEEVMFKALSSLPTRRSALEGAGFAQWPENPPQGLTSEFYGKILQHARSIRHIKYDLGAQIIASMAKLDQIFSNEAEPGELLPALAEEVNRELAERPWNR